MNIKGWFNRHPTLKRLAMSASVVLALGMMFGVGSSMIVHSTPAYAWGCIPGYHKSGDGCVVNSSSTGSTTSTASSGNGSGSTSGTTPSGNTSTGKQSSSGSAGTTTPFCSNTECQLTGSYTNTAPGTESVGNGQYTHNDCAADGDVSAYNASGSYCSPNGCPANEVDVNGVCQGETNQCTTESAQWTFSSCVNGSETETSHNVCTGAVTGTSVVSCGSASSGSSSTPSNVNHHNNNNTGGGAVNTGGGSTTPSQPACPAGETMQTKDVTSQDCSTTTTYVSTGCHKAVETSRQVCKTTSYACESAQNGRIIWRGTCHSQSCHWVPTSYHTVCGSKAVTSQTCTPVTSTEQVCAAPPAPACTATSTTSCEQPVWTGCSGTGEATGYEECTTTKISASCVRSIGQPVDKQVSEATTGCTAMVQHQCAPEMPGYAEKEHCYISPTGGVVSCKGWSAPYYDPKGCPVPTPVDIGGL